MWLRPIWAAVPVKEAPEISRDWHNRNVNVVQWVQFFTPEYFIIKILNTSDA
jgi:hypothetical protein